MRAVRITAKSGLETLTVIDETAAKLTGPNDVLVRWHATSLNYHDLMVAKGLLPTSDGRVPMSDGAGEIVEIGSDVQHWQVGDQVMGLFFPNWRNGRSTAANTQAISGETSDGFAIEMSAVNEHSLTAMPAGYSYAEAATLPCAALTAWRGLMVEGGLQLGESVLIEGSGGMSIFALQLAKAAGATVIATTSSDAKAERLERLGADHVVNYRSNEKWGSAVYKLVGEGVDHVLDVGGSATIQQSIAAARVGGHISLIGILGGAKGTILFPKLFFKQQRLTGLAVGSASMQRDLVTAIETNGIKPIIDREFDLAELADAFRHQESGEHFGKIVVTI